MSQDAVNNPAHYTSGGIEVIDAIEAWDLNFHRGNAVKYVARAGKKDPAKELEDLRKARWYIDREIVRLEPPVAPSLPQPVRVRTTGQIGYITAVDKDTATASVSLRDGGKVFHLDELEVL